MAMFQPQGGGSDVQLNVFGINYIGNPDAESGTVGWATYADAAGTSPVNGTGGSPTVTWTRSTSSPLRQTGSFLLTKDANNRQGEGASYDFTISSSDQGMPLQIGFEWTLVSGTFTGSTTPGTNSDVTVWIYDVTNGTVIQPAGYLLESAVTTGFYKFRGTFQTAINSTSYRLIFHVTTTSASAYVLKFDTISVGPQIIPNGAVVTDWQSYTPTLTGFGTPSNVEFQWRRNGDTVQIKGKFTGGTSTAVEARASLPSGLTSADTTKIPTIQACGSNFISANAAQSRSILCEPSVGYVTFGVQASGSAGLTKQLGNGMLGSGETLAFFAQVPIAGWSSNVQMSNDADTRVVSARVSKSGNQGTFNTETKITSWAVVKDSHGSWDAGNNRFNIQVSGDYILSIQLQSLPAATATQAAAYRLTGGSSVYIGTDSNGNATDRYGGTVLLPNLKAGVDYIEIYQFTDANTTVQAGDTNSFVSLWKLSGPSQIAASETVSARYTGSTSSVTASGNVVVCPTKSWDTHGAYNPSTGTFTAPTSGKYRIAGYALSASVAWSATHIMGMYYSKNGGGFVEFARNPAWNSTTQQHSVNGSDEVQLLAGETLQLVVNSSVTNNLSAATVVIDRVGNY